MIRIKSLFFLTLMFCFSWQNVSAQNAKQAIDSLLDILTAKEDTGRVNTLNELSSNYIIYGSNEKAKLYADLAFKLADKLKFNKGKATAYGNIGTINSYFGNNPEALKNYHEALNNFQQNGDKAGIAKSLVDIGDIYRKQGDNAGALKNFQESLNIEEEIRNKTGIARSLNNIGIIYITQGDHAEALKNLQTALKIAKEIGDKQGMAISLRHIGLINDDKGDYPAALKNYQAALKFEQEIGNKRGVGSNLNNMGIIYDNQGNFQESLKCYLAALKLFQEVGFKYGVANSFINIGYVYNMQGNYPEALRNDQAALKVFQEIGDKHGIALSYNNISNKYHTLGNYPEALKNCQAALKIYNDIGDKRGIALANNNLGQIYEKQGDYSEGLKYLLLSLNIYDQLEDKQGMADDNVGVGIALYKRAITESNPQAKQTLTESIQYLSKGLKLAEEIGASTTVHDAYEGLADSYGGLKDYQKALEYHKLYSKLKDSIMNNETSRKLEQQRTQFEVEKAVTEEKAEKEKVLAEQKLRSEKKDELLLAGFGALVLISMFLILFIRQRNQKKRAIEKAEALHKMAELELQSLRAQLNPHFMFNSLNAIQDLIVNEDNERSHLYLSRFSKLLRILLDNANQPFVSIGQELNFLELYLSLENLRIPDLKFSIEKDPNINTEERMMPNMMLQPYIENAIWHGLSNKKGNRNLHIRIHENGSATEFEIEDNGIGRKKAAELKKLYRQGHHSKGMELLSKRFSLLSKEYGAIIETTVTDLQNNGEATGTLVKIDIPFTLSEKAKQLVYDTNHYN